MIDIDFTKPIFIWARFGVSYKLYLKNNRPKDIRVFLIEVLSSEGDMVGQGTYYRDFFIRKIATLQLQDINRFQKMDLPDSGVEPHDDEPNHQFGSREHHMLLAVEILTVYQGTHWNDTYITEIRN